MPQLFLVFICAMLVCASFLALLYRLLPFNFLAAQKNERSNHTIPARQIGGLAIVPTILIMLLFFYPYWGLSGRAVLLLELSGFLLWLVGLLDDRFDISVRLRLAAQIIAALLGIAALNTDFQLFTILPAWLEFALLVFMMLVWINVTNFMDGLDLMTVSGLGIPVLWIAVFGALGLAGGDASFLAALISGALLGFCFFNRHPAKVFLGDSGSLPLGMLSCYVFLLFAQETSIWLALTLPLYYVLDAGSTIILRLCNGENILKAHSSHAYQKAKRAGGSVWMIIGYVALLNIVLGVFVLIGLFVPDLWPDLWIELTICLAGMLMTWLLLRKFRSL